MFFFFNFLPLKNKNNTPIKFMQLKRVLSYLNNEKLKFQFVIAACTSATVALTHQKRVAKLP